MKDVGFIKEYNNIPNAICINEIANSDGVLSFDLERLLLYLDKGILVLAWMGYFVDKENNHLIAPDSYYTDGVWVWPAYLSYFLNKHNNMKLDSNFIDYVIQKNYKFTLSINFYDKLSDYENEVSNIINNVN